MVHVLLRDGWASPHDAPLGLFTANPIIRIDLPICLIHSGLLSHRKKQKAKEKRGKSKPKRTFHLHHDPKSGPNLCCHKFTPLTFPFVLLVSLFSMFSIAHVQQTLALLFSVARPFHCLSCPGKTLPSHLTVRSSFCSKL